MSGFQDNLTELSAPAVGTTIPSGPTNVATSNAAQIGGLISGLFGIADKAMPVFDKIATDSKIEDYSNRWRKLSLASEQGQDVKTRRRQLELEIVKDLDTKEQQTFKADVGIEQFSIDIEGKQRQMDEIQSQKIGEAMGYTGAEAYTKGQERLGEMRKLQSQIDIDTLEKSKRTLELEEEQTMGYSTFKGSFSTEDAALTRNINFAITQLNFKTPQGQEQALNMASELDNLIALRSDQVRGMEGMRGQSSSYITGAIKGATEHLQAFSAGLKSRVESTQKAVTDALTLNQRLAQADLGKTISEINPLLGNVIAGDPTGRAAAAIVETLVQTKNDDIQKIVKAMSEPQAADVNVSGEEGITVRRPFNPFKEAIKVFRDQNAVANEPDKEHKFELTRTASISVKNFQADKKITAEELPMYQTNFLNLMDGVKSSTKTSNQMSFLKHATTETHRQYIKGLSVPERDALTKKTADAALYTARQHINQKIGIPDAFIFDSENGVFVVNVEAQEKATLSKLETPTTLGIAALMGDSPVAKDTEAKALNSMVNDLNYLMGIIEESTSTQSQAKGVEPEQIKYMAAIALAAGSGGALKVKGKIDIPTDNPFTTKIERIMPQDVIDAAFTSIRRETDETIGSVPRTRKPLPYQG